MRVEDRMREVRAPAGQRGRIGGRVGVHQRHRRDTGRRGKHPDQRRQLLGADRLVERDDEVVGVHHAEVDAGFRGCRRNRRGATWRRDVQRVEELAVALAESQRLERGAERVRQRSDSRGNRAQSVGAVVDRVHRGHVGQQRLRGADVRGRLLASDVLLARLQGHAVRRAAAAVDRHADDAARHLPHVCVPGREKRGVRPAVAQRHAEALRVADDDVGAEFAGRRQQRQGQQIGGHRHQHAGLVGPRDETGQLVDPAALVRILDQQPEDVFVKRHRRRIHFAHRQAKRLGA